MKIHKEIILVEGKNDTQKIKRIFPNAETIETNGYDLTKDKIELIKKINSERGIICFLDPDRVGKKIRDVLIKEIPNLTHAFISLDDIKEKSKKMGVAEADDLAIKNALTNLFTDQSFVNDFSWDQYLSLNLNNKIKRIALCKKLKIPYYNHKQLFNILKIIGMNYNQLKQVINE
ncbi:MAG: ribonuclease M5 [Mycoplasmoidaceae bacterium]